MKVLIVTDAWEPQVNGVVTTMDNVGSKLAAWGHEVRFLSHFDSRFRTLPCPTYPEIRFSLDLGSVGRVVEEFLPDAIHICTEGTLGLAARALCLRKGLPFTTAYHTKTPEYLKRKLGIPLSLGYAFMRWFHRPSAALLVATKSLREELLAWGFRDNLKLWTRGTDLEQFRPERRSEEEKRAQFGERKVLLYVGRISAEKNLEAFLRLNPPGTVSCIVGAPSTPRYLAKLQQQFPHALFPGVKKGAELAWYFANADAFVFPSQWDTYGVVMLEAGASGTPVAGGPFTGPKDLIITGLNGAIDEDLGMAIQRALQVDRKSCAKYTRDRFSWDNCAQQFLETLVPLRTTQIRK